MHHTGSIPAIVSHERHHPLLDLRKVHVFAVVQFDALKILLVEQVEDGDQLPLNGPRVERVLLDQADHLSNREKKSLSRTGLFTYSGVCVHIYSSTYLLTPFREAIGDEASVGGDDHSLHVHGIQLVLLKILLRTIEMIQLHVEKNNVFLRSVY